MKAKFVSTALLAAITTFGLGIAPALAAQSGYVYPDFWGTQATQQAPSPSYSSH